MPTLANKCPCRHCVAPRRHPGCHSNCHTQIIDGKTVQGYVEWREQLNTVTEKEKAEKTIERTLSDFRIDGINKALKKNSSIRRRMHHK